MQRLSINETNNKLANQLTRSQHTSKHFSFISLINPDFPHGLGLGRVLVEVFWKRLIVMSPLEFVL
jgi:hypothetical protein